MQYGKLQAAKHAGFTPAWHMAELMRDIAADGFHIIRSKVLVECLIDTL